MASVPWRLVFEQFRPTWYWQPKMNALAPSNVACVLLAIRCVLPKLSFLVPTCEHQTFNALAVVNDEENVLLLIWQAFRHWYPTWLAHGFLCAITRPIALVPQQQRCGGNIGRSTPEDLSIQDLQAPCGGRPYSTEPRDAADEPLIAGVSWCAFQAVELPTLRQPLPLSSTTCRS